MATSETNPEYSIRNPRWKGDLIPLLTTLIADMSQPVAERERAAEVLKYCLERAEEFREHPTVKALPREEDRDTLVKMFVGGVALAEPLWERPENWVIEEPSEKNQLKHRQVVRREESAEPAAQVVLPAAPPSVEPPKPTYMSLAEWEEVVAVKQSEVDELEKAYE